VAVPLPLSVKLTPVGSVPVSPSEGAGDPVVVTVKVPAVPTVKAVDAALAKTGPWPTMIESVWLAFGPTPFAAVMLTGNVPVVLGVPDRSAVPLPWSASTSPSRAPTSVMADVGEPVVVTAYEPD
jgi:hypothetical protein